MNYIFTSYSMCPDILHVNLKCNVLEINKAYLYVSLLKYVCTTYIVITDKVVE